MPWTSGRKTEATTRLKKKKLQLWELPIPDAAIFFYFPNFVSKFLLNVFFFNSNQSFILRYVDEKTIPHRSIVTQRRKEEYIYIYKKEKEIKKNVHKYGV